MTLIKLPTDHCMGIQETLGYVAFFNSFALNVLENGDARRGWWLAHRRVFAEGAIKCLSDLASGDCQTTSPYEHWSCADEAWRSGYEEGGDLG